MYSNTQTDKHLYVQSHLLYCCTLSTLDEEVKAPLAILFCEDEVQFVFFPFVKKQSSCIDGIVTPAIPLFTSDRETCMISEEWFSFVCYYLENFQVQLLKSSGLRLILPHMTRTNFNISPLWANSEDFSPSWTNSKEFSPSWTNSKEFSPSWANSEDFSPSWANSEDFSPSWANSEEFSPNFKIVRMLHIKICLVKKVLQTMVQ